MLVYRCRQVINANFLWRHFNEEISKCTNWKGSLPRVASLLKRGVTISFQTPKGFDDTMSTFLATLHIAVKVS